MSLVERKACQLCGPVTGRPREEAVREFGDAAVALMRAGAEWVADPTRFVKECETHEAAMAKCLRCLVGCGIDVLVTLPGWEGSEGAALEVAVAHAIGVRVAEIGEVVK